MKRFFLSNCRTPSLDRLWNHVANWTLTKIIVSVSDANVIQLLFLTVVRNVNNIFCIYIFKQANILNWHGGSKTFHSKTFLFSIKIANNSFNYNIHKFVSVFVNKLFNKISLYSYYHIFTQIYWTLFDNQKNSKLDFFI